MKTQDQNYTLFLFKRNFTDNGEQTYFCPFCLRVEGLMALFPEIRHAIKGPVAKRSHFAG